MCGIAGYVQRQSDTGVLLRMMDRLRHRGPDGAGDYKATCGDWEVALGHRRLAIIDLAGGRQPLSNEDAAVWITFNGEIYNFCALRADLESRGHRFATRSDTEVIVHHYEEYGAAGLAELNGMFTFALWDSRESQLVLVRDRIGIKPLYYAPLPDGGIAFASELTSLFEHPGIPRSIDCGGLASFLFSDYIPPPHTIARGVFKLEPGHFVVWRNGILAAPAPFWRLGEIEPRTDRPMNLAVAEKELADELWRRAGEAVSRQLVADVPLGVFLSGGIDSSVVAALAQAHTADPILTFSVAFEDSDFDESAYARVVASHLGTRHVEQTLHPQALLDHLDAALDTLDEPMGDPSIVPTYLLSRLAAGHVKVALGGDGGDELWAGYPTYRAHRYASAFRWIPELIRRRVLTPAIARLPINDRYQSFEWKAKRFAGRWDDDSGLRHLRWMSATDLPDLRLAVPTFRGLPEPWLAAAQPRFGAGANSLLALDLATYLPGAVLTKVDRASMAHGLEVRPPLLDNELVDWAFSLPAHLKLRGNTGKYLLKRAARGRLPDSIIARRKKGFGIPLARWLRGPLRCRVESILRDSPLWELGVLDRGIFIDWNGKHQARCEDRSKPLWSLIVLDHWARRTQVKPA